MRLRELLVLSACALSCTAWAQEAEPATEVVDWDFEDGDLSTWRHKDNAEIAIVNVGGERGNVLQFATDYGEYTFAWTTNFPGGRMDFSGIYALEFVLRGDGSGATVRPTLGVLREGESSLYYTAPADEVALDFTGWQRFRLHIPRLRAIAESNILDDLQRIGFVQFMVTAGEDTRATTIAIDDIRAIAAEGEEAEELAAWREQMERLYGPMPRDGSNILPNGGFELSLDGERPELWGSGDWGTDSGMAWLPQGGRDGGAAVQITCPDDRQRGSYQMRLPVDPGPYRISAWYRAETPQADARSGPVLRVSYINEEGRGIGNDHFYGDPAAEGWRKLEGSFRVERTTPHVVITLFNYFAQGSVRWDDVTVAWDVAEERRLEQQRRRNLADLEEARPMVDDARQRLEALRERLEAEDQMDEPAVMLTAMLQWAIDDAELAVQAELGSNARETLESAIDYIDRADEILQQARADPLEKQDPEADANPYVAALNERMETHAREPEVYRKGEDGYQQIENAWRFRSLGDDCCTMAWGLTHPRSAWHGNPELVRNLLATMQAVLQNHRDGDWNPGRTARFGADPNIPRFTLGPTIDAFYQLQQHLPWLLLPAKRQEWLDEIRVCVEHQYEDYGLQPFRDGTGAAGRYPNQDVYYLLIMELAHRLYGDQEYADHVDWMLDQLEGAVYPMGAMTYVRTQNECFNYHNLNITFLARYLEYTGDEQARRIIEMTEQFYPLMVEPSGLVENYTDSSWKHYEHAVRPHGPDIVATMTGSALNKRCAEIGLGRGDPGDGVYTVFTVPWWSQMDSAALPDDYIMFDEDVEAPRARFGPFSFAANGRDYGQGYIGKDTFIGCLYSPVDAGEGETGSLMVATNEFRVQPEGIHWRNARFVSGDEEFSEIIGDGFASIAVRYRLTIPRHGRRSEALPWEGSQQWFASPQRLVGLLHIAPLEDWECAGIWGRLRFGRGGVEIERSPEEELFFKYGPLLARIHGHNYASVEVQPSEVFYLDEPEQFKGREIILRDAESATPEEPEKRTVYAAGTDHWFLAEVLPYTSELAEDVAPIHDSGLRGLTFREGDVTWFVVHNLDDTERVWQAQVRPGAQCTLFTSGEHGDGRALGVEGGRVQVKLDSGGHIAVKAVAP
ncbi:MAG: carbohydrate binding domain-containing protein [Armatimonadota bacterium]|nr:carbohydrate binding domain-containing protein [Armatimonadota bacterium]